MESLRICVAVCSTNMSPSPSHITPFEREEFSENTKWVLLLFPSERILCRNWQCFCRSASQRATAAVVASSISTHKKSMQIMNYQVSWSKHTSAAVDSISCADDQCGWPIIFPSATCMHHTHTGSAAVTCPWPWEMCWNHLFLNARPHKINQNNYGFIEQWPSTTHVHRIGPQMQTTPISYYISNCIACSVLPQWGVYFVVDTWDFISHNGREW